jgi:hypothetical protein
MILGEGDMTQSIGMGQMSETCKKILLKNRTCIERSIQVKYDILISNFQTISQYIEKIIPHSTSLTER